MAKRRILLAVHSAQRGGAERIALDWARYLKESFELVIAIPDGPLRSAFAAEGELIPPAETLPLGGARAKRWAASSVRTVEHSVRLAALIRRRRISLVLTNSTVLLAPVVAARLARVPAIVHACDPAGSRLQRPVLALLGALADTVIAISGHTERQFPHARKARVVRRAHGVEIPDWTANGESRSTLGLCVLGTVERRKGQDVALEALATVRANGVDARLELVGREQERRFAEGLRQRAHQIGVADHVSFAGQVSDVDGVLARTDILLVPSRDEPLGLSPLEASARGIPVVASEVGGLPEVVDDGQTGLLTPPEDAAALAEAVLRLAADRPAAREMGQRGRAYVASRFSLSGSLEALRDDIERALSA